MFCTRKINRLSGLLKCMSQVQRILAVESSEFGQSSRVKMSELKEMGGTSDLPFLKKIMVGWEGITDESGKDSVHRKRAAERC